MDREEAHEAEKGIGSEGVRVSGVPPLRGDRHRRAASGGDESEADRNDESSF